MTISAGSKIGSYEILTPLGAGGMGEVWKAHDSRINRDVAIKVLPEEVTANPDRLARFEQEAQAAGALNHPNILTVFEMGTQSVTCLSFVICHSSFVISPAASPPAPSTS